MTEQMYQAILEEAEAEIDADGTATLPAERSLTLYGAHDGVSVSFARVVAIEQKDGIVSAQDAKGELFMVHLEDLFAAAITGGAAKKGSRRKAGFIK